MTKPDVQKEGKKLNSDSVKSSPIKKLKNAIKKDNQNEVLETNFVPLSGKLKLFRKLIFSIKKMQNFTRQSVNEWVNQFSSKSFSQTVPWNFGIKEYMLRENVSA